jgi:molybdopterin converting factor small subunit
MTVKVEAISWLTRVFQEEQRVRRSWEEEVEGADTVRDFFQQLCARYPQFGELVYDTSSDNVTGMVSVIFNDRVLELAGGLDAEIHDGDSIVLLPAFAGGG